MNAGQKIVERTYIIVEFKYIQMIFFSTKDHTIKITIITTKKHIRDIILDRKKDNIT